MAKCHVSNVDDPRRPPSMRRTVMIDTSRGVLRVRKWPTPRPGPRNATNTCWTEWLRQAMAIYRHADPQLVEYYRQVTCGLPAKVTDPFISNSRGSFAAWPITRNIYMYPRQAVRKVAYSLDVISQIPGSILVRHHDMWRYIEPGPAGSVLTSMGPYQVPQWSSDGEAPFTPPLLTDYPDRLNDAQLTAEQSPNGPLVLSYPRATATNELSAVIRPYNTRPARITLVVSGLLAPDSFHKIGLVLHDEVSNRQLAWSYTSRVTNGPTALEATTWRSPTQFNAGSTPHRLIANRPVWLRLIDTGEQYILEYGLDGVAWRLYSTIPTTDWIPTPTHYGLMIGSNSAGTIGPIGSVHHLSLEAL